VFRLASSCSIEESILSKASHKKALDNKIIQAGMFNDKATDQERNFKLRDIISKELETEAREGDENAIDEIYTD
jgi:ATP-dependent helicase STH1/SNF2